MAYIRDSDRIAVVVRRHASGHGYGREGIRNVNRIVRQQNATGPNPGVG